MNKKQKIMLLTTAAVLVLMLLFPPFHLAGLPVTINAGYGCISRPPMVHEKYATVNVGTLLAQCLIVVAVGGICCFAFKERAK